MGPGGQSVRAAGVSAAGWCYHERLPAYANGWYGGATTADEFAEKARDVVARGYRAMKFDPFGTAWRVLSRDELAAAIECVAKVREAVGPRYRPDDRIPRAAGRRLRPRR